MLPEQSINRTKSTGTGENETDCLTLIMCSVESDIINELSFALDIILSCSSLICTVIDFIPVSVIILDCSKTVYFGFL